MTGSLRSPPCHAQGHAAIRGFAAQSSEFSPARPISPTRQRNPGCSPNRAHTDPDLYARWVGPKDITTRIEVWDCHRGGSWAFSNVRGDESYSFHGCFHEICPARDVGINDGYAKLDTLLTEI